MALYESRGSKVIIWCFLADIKASSISSSVKEGRNGRRIEGRKERREAGKGIIICILMVLWVSAQ